MPPKRVKKKNAQRQEEFKKSVESIVNADTFTETEVEDFVVVENKNEQEDLNMSDLSAMADSFVEEEEVKGDINFDDFKKDIQDEPVQDDVDLNNIDIQGESFVGDFSDEDDAQFIKNDIPPVNPNDENRVLEPEKNNELQPQDDNQHSEGGQPDEPVKVDEEPVVEENKDVVINQQNQENHQEEQVEEPLQYDENNLNSVEADSVFEVEENPVKTDESVEIDLNNLNSVNLSGINESSEIDLNNLNSVNLTGINESSEIDPNNLNSVNLSNMEEFVVEGADNPNNSDEIDVNNLNPVNLSGMEEFKIESNDDSIYVDPKDDSIIEEKKDDKPVLNKEAINNPNNTGVQNEEIKANANVDENIVDNADMLFRNNWEFNKALSDVLKKEVADIKKDMTPLDKLQQKPEEKKEEAEEKKEEPKNEEKKEEVKENSVENLSVVRLYQMGLLRKADGSFFDANEEIKDDPEGNQKIEHMLSDEIRQNGAAYVVHLGINQDNTKVNKLSITPVRGENGSYDADKLVSDEIKINFVDPAKKKQYLDRLQSVKEAMDQNGLTSRDSAKYIAFKETLDKKLETLALEPDIDKFKKDFNEISLKANDYVIEKIGQKTNARRLDRINISHEVEDLNEAVQNDVNINENFDNYKKLRNERMRKTVAEKFVKAYAMKRSQLKDPAAKADGENLLNDPDAFEEKVQKAMEQKWFKALYCQEGSISQKRLQEAAETTDINKVFTQISEEAKNPKIDVEKFEEPSKKRPPLRMETYKKDLFISEEVKDDFKNKLADIKHGMDELWFEPYTSDQFKKLKYEVEVAQIMINSGATYLDYNQMAANIGDAADGYLRHKMSDSKTDNTRGLKRDSFAMQLREIADAMNNNKKADIPEESELLKEQMKERIVYEQIKTLQKTKSPADEIHANKLANNPEAFKKAVESIGNSQAFKNMTDGKSISELKSLVCGGGAQLSKLLKEENTKILNNGKVVNKNKVKENPDASLENKSIEEASFQL